MNKGFFARQALRKLGIRADEYSIDNDELRDALCELEAMMANWDGRGLRFSFQFADNPENVNPNEESNVPDWTQDAIIWQLASRLAPDYGKASDQLRQQASASLNTLYMSLDIPSIQYERNMPIGSGNNHRFNQYFRYYRPSSELLVENAHTMTTNNGRAFVSGGQQTTTTGGGTPTPPVVPSAPDTPTGLAASVSGVGATAQITWSWNPVPNAIGYVLRRDGNVIFTAISPDQVQFLDTPGSSGVYAGTVTAYNQHGESSPSAPVNAVVTNPGQKALEFTIDRSSLTFGDVVLVGSTMYLRDNLGSGYTVNTDTGATVATGNSMPNLSVDSSYISSVLYAGVANTGTIGSWAIGSGGVFNPVTTRTLGTGTLGVVGVAADQSNNKLFVFTTSSTANDMYVLDQNLNILNTVTGAVTIDPMIGGVLSAQIGENGLLYIQEGNTRLSVWSIDQTANTISRQQNISDFDDVAVTNRLLRHWDPAERVFKFVAFDGADVYSVEY